MFGRNRKRILDYLAAHGESSSKDLVEGAKVGVASFYPAVLRLERQGLVEHRRGHVQRTFKGDRVYYYYRLAHQPIKDANR